MVNTIFLACSLFLLTHNFCLAQTNYSYFSIEFRPLEDRLKVRQKIVLDSLYTNNLQLQVWANAYKNNTSELNKVKLEDRSSLLNFAQINERGWVEHLQIKGKQNTEWGWLNEELIQVDNYLAGDTIFLSYIVKLPHSHITQYGIDDTKDVQLKYFLIKPALVVDCKPKPDNFRDLEAVSAPRMIHQLDLNVPKEYKVQTNLSQTKGNTYYSNDLDFIELSITKESGAYQVKSEDVILDFKVDNEDQKLADSITREHLKFLGEYGGNLNDPLYISNKFKKQFNFIGVDEIKIPIIGTIAAFEPKERIALKSMSVLSHAYFNQKIYTQNNENAWIKNGLAVYVQLKYIQKTFPNLNLLGNLPDRVHIKNFYPFNHFGFTKIKMSERYNLLYQFIARSNTDQPINTAYSALNKANQIGVNSYKAGLGFLYLEEFLGEAHFKLALNDFIKDSVGLHTVQGLRKALVKNSNKEVDWFFSEFIQGNKKLNFAIEDVETSDDEVKILIKNKNAYKGPFKVSLYNEEGILLKESWESEERKNIILLYDIGNVFKVVINENNLPPEINLRDNYYQEDSWLGNKKIKFRFLKDIEDPQYNQIFYIPKVSWNNYNKVLFGVKFSNSTILPQPLQWNLTPLVSTGSTSLVGSGNIKYSFYPNAGKFRRIQLGGGGAYLHYKPQLSYLKYISYAKFNFRQPLRSIQNRSLSISFEQFNRELYPDATPSEIELKDYNLLSLKFNQINPELINETRYRAELQISNRFKKLFGDIFWRWQYKKDAYLTLRAFGGVFLKHDLNETDYFDFGLDRITDYTFSYPLLGRSEDSGIFSQQFVWAEGGFKSRFNKKSDQFMFTINGATPIWKSIEIYGDVGVFKNTNTRTKFLYDSGLRLNLIPDFLELYFPIQSSLGFELKQPNYLQKIRYVFTFDFNQFINYWRRGRF